MTVRSKKPANRRNTAEAILEAAERLCAQNGIEAMSIRDVAAAVGISVPVIYHHYGSRGNLLRSICLHRFGEIASEYRQLLATLEAQESPTVRDIIRCVLQPVNHWRRPGREVALQFYALALVCPVAEVKEILDAGVANYHRPVALLQRALPHLSHEEICWRLYFTLKLSHLNAWDASRLAVLSDGRCDASDPDDALTRAVAFAESAFLAPHQTAKRPAFKRAAKKSRHRGKSSPG